MAQFERILVLGCGGLGGIAAARLSAAGQDVTAVTGNDEIAAAVNADGLTASYDVGIHNARFPAVARLDDPGQRYDFCLLAVPPDRAVAAVEEALPFLTDAAPVVCLPNGLIEERLEAVLEHERIVGAIVEFGARMLGPGRVAQTAPGGFTVGRLRGASIGEVDSDLRAIEELLALIGPVHPSQNLRGARWSKLAINCAISSLGTIGGHRLGVLMRHRFVRRLALETMTEVVEIARAEGVQLEKVSGTLDLEWLALDDEERLRRGGPSLLAKHTLLLAVGAKYRKMRSSMLSAIERGRRPPVDFLNGEITDRGQTRGLPTPVNEALRSTVHAIAEGHEASSIGLVERVYEETRETLRELQMVG